MDSWRNVEKVRRCFARLEDRNIEMFLELMHPAVEFAPPASIGLGDSDASRTYLGHEGVRHWFAGIARLSDYRVRHDGLLSIGDQVLADGQVFIRESGGGSALHDICFMFRFRAGLIASLRVYADKQEALAAAGALTTCGRRVHPGRLGSS